MAQPTVLQLVEAARLQHWTFRDIDFPEGAALLFLNTRQRTLLAEYGASIEGLVTTAAEIAAVIAGELVGVDAGGAMFVTTTFEDGYSVHLDATGAMYIDPTSPLIAMDPFGASGGTPGFPLPTDFVRFVNAVLVLDDDTLIPLDINEEAQRLERHRVPMAFINGNRVVPARPLAQNNSTSDVWSRVVSVQFSYIGIQTFTALSNVVTLPTVLCESMVASLAAAFARQSEKMPAADRRMFIEEERLTEQKLAGVADHMIRHNSSVIFKR